MTFFITTQYFSLTVRVCFTHLIGVAAATLKASLLYALLEGDCLCPEETEYSRHKWSGGGGAFFRTLMVRGDR